MTNARTRAVIVVFNDDSTDTEAASMRLGINMFKGVQRVIPVRGVPTDEQARTILARDELTLQLAAAEQQRDELASRVRNAQEAVTGPVPLEDLRAYEPEPQSVNTEIALRAARRRGSA